MRTTLRYNIKGQECFLNFFIFLLCAYWLDVLFSCFLIPLVSQVTFLVLFTLIKSNDDISKYLSKK